MGDTFFLQLATGERLPETEDLFGPFDTARAMNRGRLSSAAAAVFMVRTGKDGARKLIPMAVYGNFRIDRFGKLTKGGSRPVDRDPDVLKEEPEPDDM